MINSEVFNTFFHNAPAGLDIEALRQDWLALHPAYDVGNSVLPLPLWAQRPYDNSSHEAWEFLRNSLNLADPAKPFCIYLHIPFCSIKCDFCDSYSFKLGSHQAERISEYVNRLCYEMRLWSEQGNLRHRPVSTVHMGGGTPTFLGEAGLSQLVECCKECFAVSPDTEWALESTVASLTPSMIETMHDLGYRRLHIGVQSLQNRVRDAIGRQRTSNEVLERIEAALAREWVVSVDLICGLPHQTLAGFIADIEVLVGLGINGFSLYELQIYPQNYKWAEKHGLTARNHIPNYFLFLAGTSVLEGQGYTKNLFNHWADTRDKNIYFTFPTRGEDLLAVGCIADGVFGDYHYRHPRYAPYLRSSHSGRPGLEGGLQQNVFEKRLQPLTTAILSGTIAPDLLPSVQIPTANSEALLIERWLACKLVKADTNDSLRLTANGSWFAGNILAELNEGFRKRTLA